MGQSKPASATNGNAHLDFVACYDAPHDATGRFDFVLSTGTRASAKTTLAKPDRRSIGETELHYLWIQLFHSALNEKGRAGFVMANLASDARASEQDLRRQLIETRWSGNQPPIFNAHLRNQAPH